MFLRPALTLLAVLALSIQHQSGVPLSGVSAARD